MKLAVNEINDSINEIEKIVLWNEISPLHFDVSDLRSKLKDIYELIAFYESLLPKFEGIFVVVSNDRPFLYEEIKIYIYARNVTPTSLFIDNIEFKLRSNIVKFRFEKLGEHIIYAEGVKNGKIVRSNIVKVYVVKIPTYITLISKSFAFLNEKVEVRGYLFDYYGNPIEANVLVRMGKEFELFAHRGSFKFNVTRSSEGFLNISIFYAGNETYESSSANISIFFSRFPVSIYIEADKTKIFVNESVNFTGITDVNISIPLYVYVNSTVVKILNASQKFNFTLNFSNPGIYVVFVRFPGNSLYKPAESNRIEIIVKPLSLIGKVKSNFKSLATIIIGDKSKFYLTILGILILLVILIYLISYPFRYSRKAIRKTRIESSKPKYGEKLEETGEIEIKERKEVKIVQDFREAYKMLFNTLISRYNLKKSLTPRELLKELRNEPFSEKLRIVTDFHEKAVYGNIKLKDDEKDLYFKLITEILEGLKWEVT